MSKTRFVRAANLDDAIALKDVENIGKNLKNVDGAFTETSGLADVLRQLTGFHVWFILGTRRDRVGRNRRHKIKGKLRSVVFGRPGVFFAEVRLYGKRRRFRQKKNRPRRKMIRRVNLSLVDECTIYGSIEDKLKET